MAGTFGIDVKLLSVHFSCLLTAEQMGGAGRLNIFGAHCAQDGRCFGAAGMRLQPVPYTPLATCTV